MLRRRRDPTADYAWVEDWQDLGCCIALARDLDPMQALQAVVTQPETSFGSVDDSRRWAEATDYTDYGTSVEATSLGGWAVIFEMNGFHATIPSVISRLSQNIQVSVVYWNVNALMQFIWAVNGSVLRSFDPLLYEQTGEGDPLPEEEGLPFGLDRPRAAAMACAERMTGVHLTKAFLDGRSAWIGVGHRPSSYRS